jgi:hypothetical protein
MGSCCDLPQMQRDRASPQRESVAEIYAAPALPDGTIGKKQSGVIFAKLKMHAHATLLDIASKSCGPRKIIR